MARRAFRRESRGFVLLAIFLVLILAVGIYFFTRLNSSAIRANEQAGETQKNHANIRDALVNFVTANGFLPCPANGTLADGLAAPTTFTVTCTSPDGVVPWATLGLKSADVMDSFQNKISYRVYSGATGLTRDKGASMVNCDSIRLPLPVPQTVGAVAGDCRADHNTAPGEFLAGKGLTVTDSGAAVPTVAFVLIAHGKNGAGAYRADGGRNTLPNIASSEYGHTQANGPFVVKAANTTELAPTDINYFDDTLTYSGISDLAGRAKVAARDWRDPPISSTTLTAVDVAAAAAAAGATPVGTSTNSSTLNINGVQISASATDGTAREISTGGGTAGYGIGVLSTSATTGGSISGLDTLTLAFGSTGQKIGIMLVDFDSFSGFTERAQLVFKNGAATVLTTTVLSCGVGPKLSSYSIDVGASFDSVTLTALTRVGSGTSSNFRLSETALCGAGAATCNTATSIPATDCPYP